MHFKVFQTVCIEIILLLYGQVVLAQSDMKGRAAEILDQTRTALGGAAALKSIQSLSASGDFRSGSESELASGNFQLDLLLPDKLIRTLKWKPEKTLDVTTIEVMNSRQAWKDSKEKENNPTAEINPDNGIGAGGGSGRGPGGGHGGGHGHGGRPPGGVMNPSAGKKPSSVEDGEKNEKRSSSLIDNPDNQQLWSDFSCLILGLLLHLPNPSQVELSSENNEEIDGVVADYLITKLDDGTVVRLAIDRKTHLPVMAAYTISPQKEENMEKERESFSKSPGIQIYFSDYKQVEGKEPEFIMMPHQITKTRNGQTVEDMRIKKFKLNSHPNLKQFEQKKQ
jgi:hypothetical protein